MDFFVTIENELSNPNADSLSLTGKVNGVDVAKVVRLSQIKGAPADQKLAKQKALIQAFLDHSSGNSSAPGDKVSL